jgi:cell division ATPase FtsA
VLREQAQAAFRKDVATVDERSAATLAVVLYELPQGGRHFVQDTARMLGIDFDSGTTLDAFRKLPKKVLTLLLQGVAWRYMNKKTGGFYPDYGQQATQQVYDEQAADFAAVVDGLPRPEPTPAGRVQQLAGIVAARWEDVLQIVRPREAGAFADELSEYAKEWRLHIAGFRAAVEAVTETAEAAGVDPARVEDVHGEGTVAELLEDARELLTHSTLAQVEAEAERQASAAPAEPEAEQPQQQDAEQAPDEGAPAPAEAEQAPAHVEPDPNGVVRVEGGTRNVRGKRPGKKAGK